MPIRITCRVFVHGSIRRVSVLPMAGRALLSLLRGGVDAEMLWTGTDEGCGYGVLDAGAVPTPLFYARRLFAQYIRRGDRSITAKISAGHRDLDGMIVAGKAARRSAILVHREPREATYDVAELTSGEFEGQCMLIKVDGGTGNGVIVQRSDGRIGITGYGVAVISNSVAGCDVGVGRDWA